MSYLAPPAAVLNRTPTSSDDASQGHVVGSTVVDTTVDPPALYVCADTTLGAALWVAAAGIVLQSAGSPVGLAYTLNFEDASVVTTRGVATVLSPGGWRRMATFVAQENQTFFPMADINPDPARHLVTRNGIVVGEGIDSDYVVSGAGITFQYGLSADTVVRIRT
jgi:hypothetical protein